MQPSISPGRPFGQRYAFIVVGIIFLALLVSAGLRSAPSVLILPLEAHFGWDRTIVSTAAAIGIALYGLAGPFAAALMQSFGLKRTILCGLAVMAAATLGSLWMTQPWHYVLLWGVISGIGSGTVAPVLAATITNRWFATRQGLVMGILTASTATGSLIFLPVLAWLTRNGAWQPVALFTGLGAVILIPVILLLLPERPESIGLRRHGEDATVASTPAALPSRSIGVAFTALGKGMRSPMFWLLFGTFFVCGLTTNGLVGTHLIAYCGDHGITPVHAAGLLSLMGLFDLFGTTASGWLTDRFDPRKLLFIYYGLRGLSLIVLPFITFDASSLALFALFYGLDWVATVPPTVKLANLTFGEADAPILFGWIAVGHQLGAALAAFGAGFIRASTGSYDHAFLLAGIFGVIASVAVMASAMRGQRFRVLAKAGIPISG